MKQKLLTFLMLALLVPVVANAYSVYKIDGIYYYFLNNEAIVSNSYGGNPSPDDPYVGDVVIPDSVTWYGRTYPVTTIGLQAFYGSKDMTSVDIPVTVTKCDFSAFYGCWGLQRVNIHDFTAWCKMTFGNDWANPLYNGHHLYLNGTEVTDVDFPSSLTTINNFAFTGMVRMKRFNIPNTVTSIGHYVFEFCDSLESVDIPNSVKSIGNGLFAYCHNLQSVTLPDSITEIGHSMFDGCYALSGVVIPDSVTSIGTRAFYHCNSLDSIDIPDGVVSISNNAFEYSGLASVEFPNTLATIGENAFAFCSKLQDIHIPASVVSMGEHAFGYCGGIENLSVASDNQYYDSRGNCSAIIETGSNTLLYGCAKTVIPNTVTSIHTLAFYRRIGLTSIDIPNSVVSIGYEAFYYCDSLKTVTFGNSLTTIGKGAFEHCMSLTGADLPNSLTTISDRAFYYCYALTDLHIGSAVDSIGKDAFFDCFRLRNITVDSNNTYYDSRENCNALIETASNTLMQGSVITVIPNTVTSVADWAFYAMKDMDEINIPGSVEIIGKSAFYTNDVKKVTIGEGVKTIDEGAFQFCREILTLDIPNSVTSIGYRAFRACQKLIEMKIGDGVAVLPTDMAYNCIKMEKLTIGSSVDSIASQAFGTCYKLTDVTCLATTPPKANYDSFQDYDATLSVPLATVEAYQATYPWSEFVEIVGILIGGDLNGDGSLNISDLTMLISLVINEGECPSCADVNGDGEVNITDVTLLINKLLEDPN